MKVNGKMSHILEETFSDVMKSLSTCMKQYIQQDSGTLQQVKYCKGILKTIETKYVSKIKFYTSLQTFKAIWL